MDRIPVGRNFVFIKDCVDRILFIRDIDRALYYPCIQGSGSYLISLVLFDAYLLQRIDLSETQTTVWILKIVVIS